MVDTEIGGAPIGAGDKVAMMSTSANRDASVFTDPQRVDVGRSPNPHLTTFPSLSPAGEPARIRSNLDNGYRHIPVDLRRTA